MHYDTIEKLLEGSNNKTVLSARDIMQLDPLSRWLIINNRGKYSKTQQDEIRKLIKTNNTEGFLQHLQQAAEAYSAIQSIKKDISKAATDPKAYDRYVQKAKSDALYATVRDNVEKINQVPDYDEFVKRLNEIDDINKDYVEGVYQWQVIHEFMRTGKASENMKRYMKNQGKIKEAFDVLEKNNTLSINHDLNERTLLGLFYKFMTEERKKDTDKITENDIRENFNEFNEYVE